MPKNKKSKTPALDTLKHLKNNPGLADPKRRAKIKKEADAIRAKTKKRADAIRAKRKKR